MKVTFTGLLLVFFMQSASAAEAWETCLDKGDFLFNANSFTKSHRLSKSECLMRFSEIGGRGAKFEVNLCDPQIHIDEYSAIDSSNYVRHYAGSAGCPAPLFGADFDLPTQQKGGVEFGKARRKVQEIQDAVKLVIYPSGSPSDAEKSKNSPTLSPEAKLACSLYLISEYLEKCVSFQPLEKGISPAGSLKSNIPGVHNQTIAAPQPKK